MFAGRKYLIFTVNYTNVPFMCKENRHILRKHTCSFLSSENREIKTLNEILSQVHSIFYSSTVLT